MKSFLYSFLPSFVRSSEYSSCGNNVSSGSETVEVGNAAFFQHDTDVGQTVTYSYSGRTVKTLTPTIGLNGNRVVVSSQTTYDTGGNVVRSVNEANGTTSVN